MNIYFVASIAGKATYAAQYVAIVEAAKTLGHTVIEDTLNPEHPDVYNLTPKEKVSFYKKVLRWITASDMVIAETSHSSLGVGHEISLALERNKPVIVLYTDGFAPHFLEGRESHNLYIAKYTDDILNEVLKEGIAKVWTPTSSVVPSYFGKLLKEFRLQAGFFTLQDLGYELERYGLEVDPSLLSHWQRGARLPKDRTVILLLIKVLANHGGITCKEEANELCEAAGRGYLTKREEAELFPSLPAPTAPEKPRQASLQIYFSAALSQKDFFALAYEKIVHILRQEGHTVYEDTTIVDLAEAVNKNKNERITYYKQILLWMEQAELMVVEVSFPSTLHIGHEMSLALERKKPVIAFYKKGHEPAFFLGREDENLIWVEYEDQQLEELVRENIRKVQSKFFST